MAINVPEIFAHEYDLDSLCLVTPRGHDFHMLITPRYRWHYEQQSYEPFTANLLASILRRAGLFLDIGAHYGFFSLLAASRNAALEIIAIEPTPVTCAVLERNVERLGKSNIAIVQCAISDFVGLSKFNVSLASDNCSFYEHPAAGTLHSVEVKTKTVDALLKNREPCPLVIKIDTEGHELAVLKGMQETLEHFPDVTLIIEFNPSTLLAAGLEPGALLRYLDEIGFEMHFLDEHRRRFTRVKANANWRNQLRGSYANLYCVRRNRAVSVCFFAHASELNGAERMLLELVDDLVADYGAVCTVVLPTPGPLAMELERTGAACILGNYGWWCRPATLAPQIENESTGPQIKNESAWKDVKSIHHNAAPALRELDPDVIWTQTMVIPWGAMLAAQMEKPHIWYVTEFGEIDHHLKFFSPFQSVAAEMLESSDQVFTCSRAIADTVFPNASKDKVQVLYCHIQPPAETADHVRADFFDIDGAVRLGIFSQVIPAKGTEDIVRAVAQLSSRGHNVELLIAGPADPDYQKHLFDICHAHGIEHRVKFAGFLRDPYPAMRTIDIAVICSRMEAFGRVGVEAMLLGKPAVYPNTGGVTEYMAEGETGYSYSPGDIDGLCDRLEKLIADPSRRAEMGHRGKARALMLFSKDGYSGEVYRNLKRLRSEGRTAARMPRSLERLLTSATGALPQQIDIGRNDPCPCGSGKRYKHCHGHLT